MRTFHLRGRPHLAMAPLLLIHLLTWRAGDASMEAKFPNVKRSTPGEIVLEEVIISGSGNNTRISANALAEEPSRLGQEILSLLSKREKREGHLTLDQEVSETQDAAIAHVEDDDDLERIKRVVAKYEPQKIRLAKRKIIDPSIDTHDTRVISSGRNAGSTTTESATDLENTYHEVLRNISRGISQLAVNNAGVTLSPYLSQAIKNLKRIPVPEATIRTSTADETEQQPLRNIDSSYNPSALKRKKLPHKKYTQPNRTIAASARASPDEESRLDESVADDQKSIISKNHLHLVNRNSKLKNGSAGEAPSNVSANPTGKSGKRRKWNAENSSFSQVPSSLPVLQSSNQVLSADNSSKKQPSLQNTFNNLQLPLKYSRVPRPFSILVTDSPQLSSNAADSAITIATLYEKPKSSAPAEVAYKAAHGAANIPPLVLPSDLFNAPPARRYFPIKRANHDFKSDRIHTAATTFASANPAGEEIAVSQRPAPYANVAAKIPAVAADGRTQGLGYYNTENPVELKTVAATRFAATYPPVSQPAAPRVLQRRKEPQNVALNAGLAPGNAYAASNNNDKTDLNTNPGVALYNKFAGLYSIPTAADVPNVLHVPQAIVQDYENFKHPALPAQQASAALSYATLRPVPLKPVAPVLPKPRLIAVTRPLAPYFDSSLLLPQPAGAGELVNSKVSEEEQVGRSEPSRIADEDETEGDVSNGKSALGKYQTQINHEAYKAREGAKARPVAAQDIHETSSKQQRKQDRDEDPYYQRSRDDDDERQDKYRGRQDEDDDEDRKSENIHDENEEEDEEDAGETREGEYVNTREDKDEDEDDDNRYRYAKYKYDRDDSEEEQPKKQRYSAGRYEDEERPVNRELTDESRYDDPDGHVNDEEYRSGRYQQQELARDDRYDEKSRRNHEREDDDEDESATEDELVARRAEDQRAREPYGKYQKQRNNNDDKRKYYSHLVNPADSLRPIVQQTHEEYGETNPKHVLEKYQQQPQRVKDYGNEEEQDHVQGETQEHAHKHEEHHDKKHGGDHKFEKGGGQEHKAEHHEHDGKKGDKGYKVWHENEKAEKGHHDKEHSSKEYDEKEGKEKKHHEEGGYHEHHDHGEKGEKAADFGEKGEHQKGHSTKGEHSVHKKDEYEKKTEFFDEFHEDGGAEKHGEHHHGHEAKKGGHEKKAHHDAGHHEEKHGKEHKYEKGGHHHEHKGHKVHEGHDHHYDHGQKHGEKGGHEHGKKWSYKKGDDGGDHKHHR